MHYELLHGFSAISFLKLKTVGISPLSACRVPPEYIVKRPVSGDNTGVNVKQSLGHSVYINI